MTGFNNNDGRVCSHNPCSKNSLWGMIADFLFQRSKVVCPDTGLAICAHCGKQIEPPRRYYGKLWLMGYAVVSMLTAIIFGLAISLIQETNPDYYVRIAICGYVSFFATMILIDRVASAIIFAMYDWEIADMEGSSEWPPIVFDTNTSIMASRRQHLHRQKSRRNLVLFIGGLLIPLFL